MTPERWRRIEELYHAAAALAPAARAGFLAENCADEDLRREVESLLQQPLTADGVLHRPPFGAAAAAARDGVGTLRQVGTYHLLSLIGMGGMGEVYRARDQKLGRDVAVKLLSGDVADPAGRRRFQREAQTASSLNHPHILTVHDVGEVDGRQYLVTELVDGGTLRDWAGAEPRSWRAIVELLVGVADGLASAHDAGILHRDIKPENVLVTRSGYAKLADFGLAKLHDEADRVRTQTDTRAGLVVGTLRYMSPEQAAGRPLDHRSDIFSFGVVLYELLSGRRPFGGDSDIAVLHAIARETPDPIDGQLPPGLRNVVEKMLEKDPADRYQTMRDVVVDLRRLVRQTGASPVMTGRPRWRRWNAATVAPAIAVLLALIGGAAWFFRSEPAPETDRAGRQYTQLTDFVDAVVSPALSPDGRMLTYIRGDSTFLARGEIYVQILPGGEPVQLTSDGLQKMSPVFSPDGSRIAYTALGKSMHDWDTWTVPVLGGAPRRWLVNASGLTWMPSTGATSRVLLSELTGHGMHMALAATTEGRLDAHRVYEPPDAAGMAHRSVVSPDGRWALVVEMSFAWLPCRLVPMNRTAPPRTVGPAGAPCTYAAWSPDGRWMYFSANAGDGYHTWRQRFPDGRPEQVTAGTTEEQGLAFFPDGRSFVSSIGADQNTVWLHDSNGDRQITSQGYAYQPRLSPDRKRLYYLLRSGISTHTWVTGQLWVTEIESGRHERLFPDLLIEDYTLSLDGRRVVFTAVADDRHFPVWVGELDGSSPPRRVGDVKASRAVFGPAGDVFFNARGVPGLHRINADGTGLETVLRDVDGWLYDVSPDGRWAALGTGGPIGFYSLDGGPVVPLCSACSTLGAEDRGITPYVVSWSRSGRFLYLHADSTTRSTYAIPLQPGHSLPMLPPRVQPSVEEVATIAGARRIPQSRAFMSDDPSVYMFMRATSHRNIYRGPVP